MEKAPVLHSFRVQCRYNCVDNTRQDVMVVATDYIILDYAEGIVQFFETTPTTTRNTRVLWGVEDVERIQPKEQVN